MVHPDFFTLRILGYEVGFEKGGGAGEGGKEVVKIDAEGYMTLDGGLGCGGGARGIFVGAACLAPT